MLRRHGICLKDENGTYFITMKTTWFYCLAEPQEAKARELIEAISYVRRQANNVAHSLARASLSYASSICHDHMPSCIEYNVMNEMS
jgi:hypothetical protein